MRNRLLLRTERWWRRKRISSSRKRVPPMWLFWSSVILSGKVFCLIVFIVLYCVWVIVVRMHQQSCEPFLKLPAPLSFSGARKLVFRQWLLSPLLFFFCFLKFRATTHSDLIVRARSLGIGVQVVHNASVMNAVGVCGLQLYRYGETISIPFFTETWRPDSFYEKVKHNRSLGLHTLCLLGQTRALR